MSTAPVELTHDERLVIENAPEPGLAVVIERGHRMLVRKLREPIDGRRELRICAVGSLEWQQRLHAAQMLGGLPA